ncbi:helix-turn-helix domain-containing protein [Burkholderia sp. PU8-34]
MNDIGVKVRLLRRRLGLTIEQAAAAAGISKPFLSQVERGVSVPSITSLTGIAKALGVSMQYFIDLPHESANVRRARDASFFSVGSAGDMYSRLSGSFPDRKLEVVVTRMPPGHTDTEVTTHAGEEFVYVMEGELEITIDGQSFRMGVGDSAHYPSTSSHSWLNPGKTETVLMWVGTPRLF